MHRVSEHAVVHETNSYSLATLDLDRREVRIDFAIDRPAVTLLHSKREPMLTIRRRGRRPLFGAFETLVGQVGDPGNRRILNGRVGTDPVVANDDAEPLLAMPAVRAR